MWDWLFGSDQYYRASGSDSLSTTPAVATPAHDVNGEEDIDD